MSDREPPNRPRKPNVPPKSGIGFWPMVILSSALVFSLKTAYDAYEAINQKIEELKSKLDKRLKDSALDISLLDAYLKYAKDGTIKAVQCDIVDTIIEASAYDQKLAVTNRQVLMRLAYLSAAENDNFIQREKAIYGSITMKAGQLKDDCKRIFNAIPVPQTQIQLDERPREWWEKVEITPDYNRRELVPDYLK